MLSIEISVYKKTGKWYTSGEAKSEKDIPIFDEDFRKFVRANLPADLGEGYVVIKDMADGEGFHCQHYTYEQLIRA